MQRRKDHVILYTTEALRRDHVLIVVDGIIGRPCTTYTAVEGFNPPLLSIFSTQKNPETILFN